MVVLAIDALTLGEQHKFWSYCTGLVTATATDCMTENLDIALCLWRKFLSSK